MCSKKESSCCVPEVVFVVVCKCHVYESAQPTKTTVVVVKQDLSKRNITSYIYH